MGVIEGLTKTFYPPASSAVIFLVMVLVLIAGMLLDAISIYLILIPIVLPLMNHFGWNPIWFGIVLVKLIEIAVITPPVGFNIFAVMSAVKGQATFADVYKGVLPFIFLDLIVLALLIMFPQLATWLPETMIR